MATIAEMAAQIVLAHVSMTPMSKEELLAEIQEVHKTLVALEAGEVVEAAAAEVAEAAPAVSMRKAFGKDKVYCMVCGKGFTTLKRHLKTAHDLTDKEYRAKFNIPKDKPLAARSYVEKRRQMAIDLGLGDNLAKARAAKGKKKK